MKFNVGDKVFNKERGVGTIEKIDPNNEDFQFLVRFQKERCLVWLSKKAIKPAKR